MLTPCCFVELVRRYIAAEDFPPEDVENLKKDVAGDALPGTTDVDVDYVLTAVADLFMKHHHMNGGAMQA